ncbi:18707_t:CDS:2 [Rhizophagus irregularis]|nr:18707_t:CDS:2 [Rhizophagus irregularis]
MIDIDWRACRSMNMGPFSYRVYKTTIDNSRRVSRSSRTSQSLKINGSTRTSQIETGLLNGFSQVEKENLGNEVVDEKRLSRVSTFVKTLFGKDK